MITDIPQANEFRDAGIGFINLAADQIFSLYFQLRETGLEEEEWVVELKQFWLSAQKPLSNALALVHQGIDFLIKARIATISPFLLLSGNPRDWPRGSERRDVAFAEFHTLDAQELVRAHDVVVTPRLPEEFVARLGEIRRSRNTIMHSVDRALQVAAKDVLIAGVDAVDTLAKERGWIEFRREYLYNTPISATVNVDHVEGELIFEALRMIELFSRNELIKYFDFDKKQRRYICPICTSRDEYYNSQPTTAQLRPNLADSTTVYCFVCGETQVVRREACPNKECKGNVIDAESDTCLSCYTAVQVEG